MWAMYSIIAAVFWGLDYTLAGKLLEKIGFSSLLAIEFLFGFISMMALTLLSGSYKKDIVTLGASKETAIYMVSMILVFIIAHILIVLSITSKNATLASLIEISYPFFIALFSWFIFKENTFSTSTLTGGILVFLGVALIYFSNK